MQFYISMDNGDRVPKYEEFNYYDDPHVIDVTSEEVLNPLSLLWPRVVAMWTEEKKVQNNRLDVLVQLLNQLTQ